ncbi:hypothetical protein GCM10010532_076860 [Dactylosporangium siamense]
MGVRTDGATSSEALPAATTIKVGTEVRATSRAEISSGRRFVDSMRWVRTSESNVGAPVCGGMQNEALRTNCHAPDEDLPVLEGFSDLGTPWNPDSMVSIDTPSAMLDTHRQRGCSVRIPCD